MALLQSHEELDSQLWGFGVQGWQICRNKYILNQKKASCNLCSLINGHIGLFVPGFPQKSEGLQGQVMWNIP